MKILTNDLDFDIDLDELLGQRVDFDKAGVDCAIESTELRNQTDVSLADWLVRVGANDTTWDRSHETNATSERVD